MRFLTVVAVLAVAGALIPFTPVFADTTPTFNIGISAPGQPGGPGGGQVPGAPIPTGRITITNTNPVPVLTSISPTQAPVGSSTSTLTLAGTGFSGTTTINIGGVAASPTSVSPTSMTVMIPLKALQAPGTVPVSVTNPAPGGGSSSAIALTVTAPPLPAPVIASVSPATVFAGSGAATVTVSGSGFLTGRTTVVLGGQAGTVTSATTATVQLSAALLANAGKLSGLVTNPTPGGGTASFSLTVANSPPTLSGASVKSVPVGSATLSLTVTGTGFVSGTMVMLSGTPLPTQFKSATSLLATIPEAFMTQPGTLPISVATGNLMASGPFTLTVESAKPTLSSVSPARVFTGNFEVTVILTGTGFGGSMQVTAGGKSVAVVYISATAASIAIPPSLLQKTGTLPIVVTNPAPGGGTSGSVSLIVTSP